MTGPRTVQAVLTLLADTGLANAHIILAPSRAPEVPSNAPVWTADLYGTIARELAVLC